MTILQGLLEISYRFPGFTHKSKLHQDIIKIITTLNGEGYLEVVNYIFGKAFNSSELQRLELFNQVIKQNLSFFKIIADNLFTDP